MKILVINSGSSSIKYQLFLMPQGKSLFSGSVEKIGEAGSEFKDHHEGLRFILSQLDEKVDAVGHRVVHGAEFFKEPTIINKNVISKIRKCFRLAPLHNPPNLEGILACNKLLPGTKQIAVFDTAFYSTLKPEVFVYAIPFEFYKKDKIRKYGFHGTSHAYVAREAARILRRPLNKLKLITCHLGNGCSITAVKNAKAVDTSMGFTPLEGLVMGTRSGDIDPAIIIYLIKNNNITPTEIDNLLNRKSGLLGVSGVSNDYRKLSQEAKKGNKRAKLAVDIFIYRIRRYIGAYIMALKGVDAVVFTAGIGENVKTLRKRTTQGIDFLKKKPKVLAIHTNEELSIAQQSYKLLNGRKK